MFCSKELKGLHHKPGNHLKLAAESGCQICATMLYAYQKHGGDICQLSQWQPQLLYYEFSFSEAYWALKIHSFSSYDSDRVRHILCPSDQLAVLNQKPRDINHEFTLVGTCSEPQRQPEQPYLIAPLSLQQPWQVRGESFNNSMPLNTGDPAVGRLAREWLGKCIGSHKSCDKNRKAHWFPARLLDLNGDEPRLLLTDTAEPQGSYATLSHCWGSEPSFLTLTASNLEDMQTGIPMAKLPRTFSDAITTTKTLRLSYLWIDSLCIIQSGDGATEDWQK
jgi:hypothetical protein